MERFSMSRLVQEITRYGLDSMKGQGLGLQKSISVVYDNQQLLSSLQAAGVIKNKNQFRQSQPPQTNPVKKPSDDFERDEESKSSCSIDLSKKDSGKLSEDFDFTPENNTHTVTDMKVKRSLSFSQPSAGQHTEIKQPEEPIFEKAGEDSDHSYDLN